MPTNIRLKNPRAQTLIRDVFLQYLRANREFWDLAQRRAFKCAPESKRAVQNAFRLQNVLVDRQALRFGHLSAHEGFYQGISSLSDLTERLDQGWTSGEETDLLNVSEIYRDIVREIKERQANLDSGSLDGPIESLQRDEKYIKARTALADTVRALWKRLESSRLLEDGVNS